MGKAEILPRQFQADLHRIYQHVIVPSFEQLPTFASIGEAGGTGLDGFLDRARMQTANLLAFEVRRCFALALAAVFERQLQFWLTAKQPEKDVPSGTSQLDALLRQVAKSSGVDLADRELEVTLKELHDLSGAVRHGAGWSLRRLHVSAPRFWQHLSVEIETAADPRTVFELRLQPTDFRRYMLALARFWGLADKQPLAVIDGPY